MRQASSCALEKPPVRRRFFIVRTLLTLVKIGRGSVLVHIDAEGIAAGVFAWD